MKTVPTFSVTSSRRTKTGSWVIVEIVVVIVLNGTPKLTGGFSVFEGSRQRSVEVQLECGLRRYPLIRTHLQSLPMPLPKFGARFQRRNRVIVAAHLKIS